MTCQAPVDMSLNNADSRKQDAGKWPWIIQMQNGCTATLIGQNHALTSSGCCSALDFKVSGFTSDNRFVQERISIKNSCSLLGSLQRHTKISSAMFSSLALSTGYSIIKILKPMDLKINEEDTICLLEYAPETFKWNDNVQPVCLSDSFDPERTCYSAKGLKYQDVHTLVPAQVYQMFSSRMKP